MQHCKMSQGTGYIVFKNGIITLCQLKMFVMGRRAHNVTIFLISSNSGVDRAMSFCLSFYACISVCLSLCTLKTLDLRDYKS